jgi:enoyl-CoA hydratase/carnithine racemase
MSSEILLTDRREGVLTLTLNRPERRNALSGALVRALTEAFESAGSDPDARVIVLTGAGAFFCSGADLSPAAAAGGPLAMHEERRNFVRLIRAMLGCGRPVIARVQGPALAGGCGLVAACDLAVASEEAHFATPEVKVGLFPMMIMALIARNVGRKRALELMYTGDKLSAADAATWGLINHAVPAGELDERVAALAAKLASLSPAILRLGRESFFVMEDMPLDKALEYLCDQLTLTTLTEDAAEGVMAFMMKRPPAWKGR